MTRRVSCRRETVTSRCRDSQGMDAPSCQDGGDSSYGQQVMPTFSRQSPMNWGRRTLPAGVTSYATQRHSMSASDQGSRPGTFASTDNGMSTVLATSTPRQPSMSVDKWLDTSNFRSCHAPSPVLEAVQVRRTPTQTHRSPRGQGLERWYELQGTLCYLPGAEVSSPHLACCAALESPSRTLPPAASS